MRAYYFDNIPGDQRLPHDSARPVTAEHLKSLNVESFYIPVTDNYEEKIDVIAKEREYKNRDFINITKEGLGDVGCCLSGLSSLVSMLIAVYI